MKKILMALVVIIILLSTYLLYCNGSKDTTFQGLKNKIDEETLIEISETKPAENEESIIEESNKISRVKNDGILPAFAFVWCRWNGYINKMTVNAERTIHFLVRGRGHHVLEWQTFDDFDGDGNWDLIDHYTTQKEWTCIFLPVRHYTDWAKATGYHGSSRVMVKYWVDGREFTKTFTK